MNPDSMVAPSRPLLEHWRGRRLYRRRPINLGWVQCTWMLGGLPLAALLNLWVLPALPLPAVTRRRIARSTVGGLAALVVLAVVTPFVAPADPDFENLVAMAVLVVAPLLAGCVLHAVFGTAVTGAYRTLEAWGGRQRRGGLVFLALPMFAGGVLSAMAFWPFFALGEALAR